MILRDIRGSEIIVNIGAKDAVDAFTVINSKRWVFRWDIKLAGRAGYITLCKSKGHRAAEC